MVRKKRLLKLAKELNTTVKEIVTYLKQEAGEEQISAASLLKPDVVQDIKAKFSWKEKEKLRVTKLLSAGEYVAAQERYELKCADWWSESDYELEKKRANFRRLFDDAVASRSLAKLDELYRNQPDAVSMSLEDFLHRKLPVVRKVVDEFESALDQEQVRAIAHPSERLLVQARAGSGKNANDLRPRGAGYPR